MYFSFVLEFEMFTLDLKIAKFFCLNNITFNAAANGSYKEMMQTLCSGHFGPSRMDLAEKLLDEVASEVLEIMIKRVCDKTQCSNFTLLIDGRSNMKKLSYYCNLHSHRCKFIFA